MNPRDKLIELRCRDPYRRFALNEQQNAIGVFVDNLDRWIPILYRNLDKSWSLAREEYVVNGIPDIQQTDWSET